MNDAEIVDRNKVGETRSASTDLDPLTELAEISRALRAYVEWQNVSGSSGLPRDPDLKRRLQEHPLPRLSTQESYQSGQALGDSLGETPSERLSETNPTGSTAKPVAYAPLELEDPPPLEPPNLKEPSQKPQERSGGADLTALGATLHELEVRIRGCEKCPLHEKRKQTVFSRGSGSSGLCFVGEGPGADEDDQGEPFVGAAGQLLDKMIHAMGFERDEVYVCNVVKCRPPENRKPTPIEMQTCSPYLERQLELLQPKVIVALGGTAVSGLLGLTEGITRTRGKFRLYQGKIAVMPTFHPAYLLRNPAAKRQVWTDLRQVLGHLGRELPRS